MAKQRRPDKVGGNPSLGDDNELSVPGKRTRTDGLVGAPTGPREERIGDDGDDDDDGGFEAAEPMAGTGAGHASLGFLPPNFKLPPPPKPKPIDLNVHRKDENTPASVAEFRLALTAKDEARARTLWQLLSDKDRLAFGASAEIDGDLRRVVRVLGGDTVHIMAQAGVDFTGRADLVELMLEVGFPLWFDGLTDHGGKLLSSFIDLLPARDKIDDAAMKKLHRLMRGTNSLGLARPLFERIYVPLADTTYNADHVRTAPWKAEYIHRLYDVLSTHLPVAHVRAVKAFHLGTQKKETGGNWEELTNAWWSETGNVVLPEKRAKGDPEKQKGHHMTGGAKAQQDPETGKGKTKGEMDSFSVAALHEVGHAVGGTLGGHAWAESYAYVGWETKQTADAWSKRLWGNDAALTARAIKKAGKKAMAAADARHYMANQIRGAALLPPDQDPEDVEAQIADLYADQPLTKYWKTTKDQDKRSESYLFSGTDAYGSDGKVHVWLSRGDAEYSSYTQKAHAKKVSWYSLASPHEWFAEQYAHYYLHAKSGTGLDAGTKTKLDELDKQVPPEAQPAGAGGVDVIDGGDDTGRRVPFPW